MKKTLITGLIAATMIITLAGCAQSESAEVTTQLPSETTVQEQIKTEADANWYEAVLNDQDVTKKYSYYRLEDINLDGVDELFLSTTAESFIGNDQKACLMAYDQGEAKTLMEIGGAGGEYWMANQSDATLSYYSRLSGEEHLTLYKYEDGKLREVANADIYQQHHYAERDNDETVYLLDGKETSQKEAESFWEQYGNKAGALTYQEIEKNTAAEK